MVMQSLIVSLLFAFANSQALAQEKSHQVVLQEQMKLMGENLEYIFKNYNKDSVAVLQNKAVEIQMAIVRAKSLIPVSIEASSDLPRLREQYMRTLGINTLAESVELEIAILNGDGPQIKNALKALNVLKVSGHKDFE